MNLLGDILSWSQSELTEWQQDAVRRLFEKGNSLSEDDFCDLYRLLKSAHGIPCEAAGEALPLSRDCLPVPALGPRVVLKAMRDLTSVNRLAENQVLSFCPEGITVIYGANASGKSGYARVLKRACRARDQREQVLPDAGVDRISAGTPSAVLEFDMEGTHTAIRWDVESPPPSELSRLSVFDSRCARTYVSDEQDIAYLPYGLDVVQNLATLVLPELTERLDAEVGGISVDQSALNHLSGDTAVGRLVSGLCERTRREEIEGLAAVTEDERRALAELGKTLAEADPAARAQEFRLAAKRVKELAGSVDEAWYRVGSDEAQRLKQLLESAESACTAELAAAELLRSDEALLPGTGEAAWKALFEAARRFSVEVACPDDEFPDTDEDAVCPLCQQPLDRDAARRLARFDSYVRDDAAENARKKREQLDENKKAIERVSVDIAFDGALRDEVTRLAPELACAIVDFGDCLRRRKEWLVASLDRGAWDGEPAPVDNPRHRLRSLAASLYCQARRHDDAVSEAGREQLEKERSELDARDRLSACASAVCDLVDRMKMRAALESCRPDLKTRSISDKAKEFASSAVTGALRDAMKEEFDNLDVGHVRVVLKERSEKGRIWHRLVLDLPSGAKLDDVLSEGEQRAIALGSFLAELSLARHQDGIIFDDPVSSLDHWRRQHVARRLVREAVQRQVVVFTHDTSFLGQLRDEIDDQRVAHSIQHLDWLDNRPGCVYEDLPWEHQSYKARLDSLGKEQRRLERLPWPVYPNQAQRLDMARQYDALRAAIERVVQDVVFAGVIQRYRDWVRMDGLERVVAFDEPECREILRLHKRCCGIVDAHDPASAKNAATPTASDLKRDIESLEAVVEIIKDKRRRGTGT